MKKSIFLLFALIALLTSCDNGEKFKVSGKIEGAKENTSLFLEVANNGKWFVVDSALTQGDGTFNFSVERPQYPNIFRITCDGKSVYFPIDSTEHLTMNTKLNGFDTEFVLDGSQHAKELMNIDKEAMKYAGGKASPEGMKAWKLKLSKQILLDPSGIVAYYIINKYIDGKPLFDPTNDQDMKIIGAVANAFDSFRKSDPRRDYLVEMTLEAQKRRRLADGNGHVVQAEQINLIDIKLQDANGVNHSLKQVASKGNVVLLNFTMYDQEFSPAYNKLLNDIYTQHKGKGITIYQIGLDENASQWRQAARNLPWITVYDPAGQMSQNVSAYNVLGIPVTFIIDRSGEIVERVEDYMRLEAAVAKYI